MMFDYWKRFTKLNLQRKLTILFSLAIMVDVVVLGLILLSPTQAANVIIGQKVQPYHAMPMSKHGHPIWLDIDSVKIHVPVIDGQYNEQAQTWTLTTSNAQFLTDTAEPNDRSGKTFIYGHYRPEVFAYLHLIQPGAVAEIRTANHLTFRYRFVSSYTTTPGDLNALKTSAQPTLMLQTCTGLHFQKRQMFVFDYLSVSNY